MDLLHLLHAPLLDLLIPLSRRRLICGIACNCCLWSSGCGVQASIESLINVINLLHKLALGIYREGLRLAFDNCLSND